MRKVKIEIRDRRNGFLWISNSFFDTFARQLNGSSLLVYLCLARMVNNDTQKCFPSYENLAERTGLSRSGVAEALNQLKSLGLIDWTKEGRHNVYFLLETNSPKIGLVQNSDQNSPLLTPEQSTGVDSNKTHNNTQEQDSLPILVSEAPKPPQYPIEKAFSYFVKQAQKTEQYTLTEKRYRMALRRWKERETFLRKKGTSPEKLLTEVSWSFSHVIDELVASPYHQENGYVEWEQLFRSAEAFEKWLDRYENEYSNHQESRKHVQA